MAKIQINEDFTQHISEIITPSYATGGLFLGNETAATNL